MEEHQGSMEKFKEFIGKAHDNGLKVILDIPLNHTGYANPMVKDPDKQDWFHHNGDVTDWNNDWQQENCSAFGLPDFNTDNPEVKNFLVEVAKFWIDTGIDGFRLDAVRSIPSNFWNEFNREVHKHAGDDFLLIGEYFHGDPAKVAPYQRDDMPSVFDYPLFFPVERVFGHGASMKEIAEELERGNNLYEHPEMMSYFPDNHDKTRLMTQVKGDREKHKLVLSFAMTLNRIPTIYYGTETGMEGADPDKGMELNRDMMKFDQNPDIKEHFKTLTSLRNSSPALQEGKLLQMYVDDDVFAFSRLHPEQEAIVVMNNGSSAHDREIAMRPESQMKDGTMLKDALSGDRVKVENGKIKTRVNEKSARIFFKE
jgi:alpha-amylase